MIPVNKERENRIDTRVIMPGKLLGRVIAMPSKSLSHRALILAALSRGICVIDNIGMSLDIEATVKSLIRLGIADIKIREDRAVVEPSKNIKTEMPVGESASTLRFLIPTALLFGGADLICSGRLPERTLAPYEEAFNADLKWEGSLLRVRGELKAGTFVLDGEAGSQFVSGLLMALPLVNGDSAIVIKGELRSKPYVDLTVDAMRQFGVSVNFWDGAYHIEGNRRYMPADFKIEGDWSHAAFYLGSNFMGSSVTVEGLDPNSLQGDRAISEVLGKTEVDLADIPDLFPILAVTACSRNSMTRFFHTERLRGKESDRVLAMEQELKKLGADVRAGRDEFIVNGTGRLKGGKAQSHGDHRVAMALATASAIAEGPIILEGCGAVQKSAPHFWDEFISLGGNAYEYLGE